MADKKKMGIGVGVMLFNDEGKVLLMLRSKKSGSALGLDGVWALPGGKVEFGESFEEAAMREIMEEVGVKILNPKVFTIGMDANEKAHFVTAGVSADKFEGEVKNMLPEESERLEWFDLEELPEIGYFPSVKMIERYKSGVFYEEGDK